MLGCRLPAALKRAATAAARGRVFPACRAHATEPLPQSWLATSPDATTIAALAALKARDLATMLGHLARRGQVSNDVGVAALRAVLTIARAGTQNPDLLAASVRLCNAAVANGSADEALLAHLVQIFGAYGRPAEAIDVLRVLLRCRIWPSVYFLKDVMVACIDAGDANRAISVYASASDLGVPVDESTRHVLSALLVRAASDPSGTALAALLPALRAVTPSRACIPGAALVLSLERGRAPLPEPPVTSPREAACAAWGLGIALLVYEGPYFNFRPEAAHAIYRIGLEALLRHPAWDPEGAIFGRLWAADVSLARLCTVLPLKVVVSAANKGQIERLGVLARDRALFEVARKQRLAAVRLRDTSLAADGVFDDISLADGSASVLANKHATSLLVSIADDLALLQGVRKEFTETRVTLLLRAQKLLSTMRALAVPPSAVTLAAFFSVLLRAGIPHSLRSALPDLLLASASASAAKALAETLEDHCVEAYATVVLRVLPDAARHLDVRPPAAALARLLSATTALWLKQTLPHCPACAPPPPAGVAANVTPAAESVPLQRKKLTPQSSTSSQPVRLQPPQVSEGRRSSRWIAARPLPIVQCRGSVVSVDAHASDWALYPSQQLALLDDAGLLLSVPDDAFVQLATAASSVPCALEAWEVWSRMRRLGIAAATKNEPLLLALMRCFLLANLPVPAWEIYAALCQPLPPGPLPSLSELKRLYSDAAAAAPAQRTISDAATAALVPAQHTRAAAAAIAAEKGDTGRDMTSCSRGGSAMATGGIDELEHAIKSSVGDAKFEALQRRVAAFEAAMDRQLKLRHNKHRDPVAIGGAKFDSGTAQASRLAAALWSVYSTAPKIQL